MRGFIKRGRLLGITIDLKRSLERGWNAPLPPPSLNLIQPSDVIHGGQTIVDKSKESGKRKYQWEKGNSKKQKKNKQNCFFQRLFWRKRKPKSKKSYPKDVKTVFQLHLGKAKYKATLILSSNENRALELCLKWSYLPNVL